MSSGLQIAAGGSEGFNGGLRGGSTIIGVRRSRLVVFVLVDFVFGACCRWEVSALRFQLYVWDPELAPAKGLCKVWQVSENRYHHDVKID